VPLAPHILLASTNIRRMKTNLTGIIPPQAIDQIETALLDNVAQLYTLGRTHFLFARRQNNRAWRQKVSRFYYGAYNASRALRLCERGDFSTDASDHKKVGDLPGPLPSRARFENQLNALRDDRNLCDYDHTATIGDLVLGLLPTEQLVTDFLAESKTYLLARGVAL
jgi:hypothetical protein